ncbi:MAG: glycosyltransferase [Anaerolineales bacterium]|nr:glycosyltransferase [Anaerolineales bacterium]
MILAVKRYQPDIVYFRFGLFTFPLQYLFRLFPTIIEVNTNDLVEYRSRGLFFYWFNRLTRDWMFSKCAGWVSTSYELAELEQNRKHKKPVCVISNGIEFEKYEPLPATGNHAPTLTLVGSPGMDWHGVDKLFFLAQACPELNINIVGYQAKDFKFSIPANIHLHGYLPPDQVKQILAQTDVVFGTLGLHRKSMSEASPLKVREALGYGIPVILAYEDTDLRDVSSEQILRLPNTENNIAENVQTIRDFAFRSIGQRIDRARISSRIDQRLKESRRVEFFAEIVEIHRRTS